MDNCVDCGRRLRDLVCHYCYQIFVPNISPEFHCNNCNKQMLVQTSRNDLRYKCQFCLYKYFDIDTYDPKKDRKLKEYKQALERECIECGSISTLNSQTEELVCRECGLVWDHPIYTKL